MSNREVFLGKPKLKVIDGGLPMLDVAAELDDYTRRQAAEITFNVGNFVDRVMSEIEADESVIHINPQDNEKPTGKPSA